MDPRLAFWTGAWILTLAVVVCALAGWREIRRGRLERHRRFMNAAVVLVLVFVASYVVKVFTLGKEALETWSRSAVLTLWSHETFVLFMVLAGGMARFLARRLAPGGPPAAARVRGRHRLAGRFAILCAVLALVTAAMILAGMYWRVGGSS